MYYALLDDIVLPLGGVSSLAATDSWVFAEHPLIGNKPALQFTSFRAAEISLALDYNYLMGLDIATERAKLLRAANQHQALALSFSNGEDWGDFVITELTETFKRTSSAGDILAWTATLKLKEYVEITPASTKKNAPAVSDGSSSSQAPQTQQTTNQVTPPKVAGASTPETTSSTLGQIVRQEVEEMPQEVE